MASTSAAASSGKDCVIHQLCAGEDFALSPTDPIQVMARSMQNFAYLVASPDGKQVIAVDPAWDVEGIVSCAKRLVPDGKLVAALFTHRHLDHCGGSITMRNRKISVPGLAELAALGVPVYAGVQDVDAIAHQCKVKAGLVKGLKDGDVIKEFTSSVSQSVTVLETPGHTPGSICLRVGDAYVITGDTLFIRSCGRSDLPESNAEHLLESLSRLATDLPTSIVVLPGHNYSAPARASTIAQEIRTNFAVRQALDAAEARKAGGGGAGGGGLRSNPTSAGIAGVALPDYLAAARKAVAEYLEYGEDAWKSEDEN